MNALRKLAAVGLQSDFAATPLRRGGTVCAVQASGIVIDGMSAAARLGDFVRLGQGDQPVMAEIVNVNSHNVVAIPCQSARTIAIGDPAFRQEISTAWLDAELSGRVVNAFGTAIDGKGPLMPGRHDGDVRETSSPLHRPRIEQQLRTGVRVIDIFTPICIGQRLGIFAGSGVGKSTLLGMLARAGQFDAVVIALVGERSREVRDFVADTLGPEGMRKATLVVATNDESPVLRRRAPVAAMEIARRLGNRGQRVLVLIDSLTRYAHALREVAIHLGEPPVARGYPSSVFAALPTLLEMASTDASRGGSVTVLATILVDGDDHNDPVSDALRGILDGHLVLSRAIANRGRFPAVDPLASISRLAPRVWSEGQRKLVEQLRAMIDTFEDSRDLRLMGAWQPGSDAVLDQAVETVPRLYSFFKQSEATSMSPDAFADLATFLKEQVATR